MLTLICYYQFHVYVCNQYILIVHIPKTMLNYSERGISICNIARTDKYVRTSCMTGSKISIRNKSKISSYIPERSVSRYRRISENQKIPLNILSYNLETSPPTYFNNDLHDIRIMLIIHSMYITNLDVGQQ